MRFTVLREDEHLRGGDRGCVLVPAPHFPTEQAALKRVYTAVMSLDATGKGQAHWTMRWKTALNSFDFTLRRPPAGSPSVTPTITVTPLV